ncbi:MULTISPECIES: hypothetical protein [Roseivirga]|jgi:hypothetical protein|uniref:Uncharacterized protein n=1 Tax=Roseivirga spongicola TaxID=333140 RepID=A0A150XEU4_9BACT|nr:MULTISPECIES: hypothetical protein [Roseivirga]KYG77223.1 hypothetical protein AWW68_00190 [Roseivirga spongicola]MBO6496598.1 hypothetical protein [Roseivirga sp.]WPZ10923.1 hypothetical protein T7867_02280 [Roseivirga spongicola]|tara:strand:- start:511 stop:867 length:357 start_codon:yes stop_codon:yes gene_type:complete
MSKKFSGKVLSLVQLFEKKYPEQNTQELVEMIDLLEEYSWDVEATHLIIKLGTAKPPFDLNDEIYLNKILSEFHKSSKPMVDNQKLDSILGLSKSSLVDIDSEKIGSIVSDLKHLSFE